MSEAIEGGAPLAPGDHRLDYYRGIALVLEDRDPAQAEAKLRHYLDTVPDNANVPSHSTAHEWLGRLYEREGQLDKAALEFQAAVSLDPHDKQASESLRALQKR
jgi:TolA-binding protein